MPCLATGSLEAQEAVVVSRHVPRLPGAASRPFSGPPGRDRHPAPALRALREHRGRQDLRSTGLGGGGVSPGTADIAAASDERDAAQRRLLDAERASYTAGFAAGYEAAQRDADRAWSETPPLVLRDDISHAELEARRWTVRGERRTRETFGQPHTGDFSGRLPQEAAA
jgi:hypothetical protein